MKLLKNIYIALIPLLILLFFAGLSAVVSYIVLEVMGDVVSMRKMISKATQIFLLLCIFPLRRFLKLSWSDVGFAKGAVFFRQLGYGFILGIVTLLPVMMALYYFDISVIDSGRDWTLSKAAVRILLALLLASLIALGEEPLFNGILLAGLRKKMSVLMAVILTSLYYATFHFVKTKTDIDYHELSITSGFQLISEAFLNVFNPEILSALIALFVVGLFLATIRVQFDSSIAICMGCHAAWVWQIKIGKDFFNINSDSDYYYLVSSYYDGVVGPLVTVWLSLGLIGFFLWKKMNPGKIG